MDHRFYPRVAHALSGCQLVERELKLYSPKSWNWSRGASTEAAFGMQGNDYADPSLECVIETFMNRGLRLATVECH